MNLPQGPVTYKYIEVGKTLYQALSTRTPRFPARVAYLMLKSLFAEQGEPLTLYDPFCGHGVILLTAYLLFPDRLTKVLGSDINPIVVDTARRNFLWLRDPNALEERLQAIAGYKTQNDELKAVYQQKCRLMFNHARGIDGGVKLFTHDATRIGELLASIEGDVALVTDPPYSRNDHWNPKAGIGEPDYGTLEPFLQETAAAPNLTSLLLCYWVDAPIQPLLERYFNVTPERGTRGRAIYHCRRK